MYLICLSNRHVSFFLTITFHIICFTRQLRARAVSGCSMYKLVLPQEVLLAHLGFIPTKNDNSAGDSDLTYDAHSTSVESCLHVVAYIYWLDLYMLV